MAGGGGKRDLLEVLLGVFISPVEVFRMKGAKMEFFICLLLWIFTFVGGTWYCFYLKGLNILADIFCVLIPPLGVFFGNNKCRTEVWIALLLCFLVIIPRFIPGLKGMMYMEIALYFPAIVYAFWVA